MNALHYFVNWAMRSKDPFHDSSASLFWIFLSRMLLLCVGVIFAYAAIISTQAVISESLAATIGLLIVVAVVVIVAVFKILQRIRGSVEARQDLSVDLGPRLHEYALITCLVVLFLFAISKVSHGDTDDATPQFDSSNSKTGDDKIITSKPAPGTPYVGNPSQNTSIVDVSRRPPDEVLNDRDTRKQTTPEPSLNRSNVADKQRPTIRTVPPDGNKIGATQGRNTAIIAIASGPQAAETSALTRIGEAEGPIILIGSKLNQLRVDLGKVNVLIDEAEKTPDASQRSQSLDTARSLVGELTNTSASLEKLWQTRRPLAEKTYPLIIFGGALLGSPEGGNYVLTRRAAQLRALDAAAAAAGFSTSSQLYALQQPASDAAADK